MLFSKLKKILSVPTKKISNKNKFNYLEIEDILGIDTNKSRQQINEYFKSGKELQNSKAYDKAQDQYHKALGNAHQIKDYQNLLKGLQILGELYQERKEFTQAIMCYNSALNLLNDEKSKDEITNKKEINISIIEKIVIAETLFLQTADKILPSKNIKEYLRVLNQDKKKGFKKYITKIQENRDELHKIRTFSENFLKKIEHLKYHIKEHNRAKKIENLFNQIRNQFKAFIQRISKESEEILGKPPCNYSLIAFGSLARGEMTPYSDLEFGILIEDKGNEITNENNKQYFRNLTNFLNISVINLGATRIRGSRTDMPLLDEYFTSMKKEGFWFDPTPCLIPQ